MRRVRLGLRRLPGRVARRRLDIVLGGLAGYLHLRMPGLGSHPAAPVTAPAADEVRQAVLAALDESRPYSKRAGRDWRTAHDLKTDGRLHQRFAEIPETRIRAALIHLARVGLADVYRVGGEGNSHGWPEYAITEAGRAAITTSETQENP